MEVLKLFVLATIFGMSTLLGIIKANRYKFRVNDLKEIQKALNMFETKMKYTYEPIPDLFAEISKDLEENIGYILKNASKKMQIVPAGQAWIEAIDNSSNNFSKEDINIIKALSKLLGKTDIEGQLSEIELTNNLINIQIKKAEEEKSKNTKLYKTLGATIGLAIIIIFI